ncbi:hypothetical protein [uncultured Herbaspirillum sp.]|uniref:hypothetical protein n=1 Tax=uncultured Herbaspirillum sp. TaxID=160236 RepID=UPI00260A7194|nr:hypothetical protein [uncultured Herbaspirillum sp.]
MGSIETSQRIVNFQPMTPICGNCQFERRDRCERENRTTRSCTKHGWFVMLSGTCINHQYRKTMKKEITK